MNTFVKLSKSDYPEILQDELEALLVEYNELTGETLETICESSSFIDAHNSPLYSLLRSLFLEGNVYKICKLEDLISFCPKDWNYHLHGYPSFIDSLTCPIEKLVTYAGGYYSDPRFLCLKGARPTDAAVIAAWRIKNDLV